jgi:hypothetical protein
MSAGDTFYQIKSSDRTSGTAASFVLSLESPFKSIKQLTEVSLVAATIPNTIYNVRTGVNSSISWIHSGTKLATLTPGNYTITDLLTLVAAAMNAADANTYAFTYNSSTFKVTATAAGAFSFASTTSSFWTSILGITDFTTSGTSISGSQVINLNPSANIYLKIDEMGLSMQTTNQLEQDLFTIPVSVAGGYLIQYTEGSGWRQDKTFYSSPRDINKLTVSLFLQNNELVELNGAEWSMILRMRRNTSYL